ncbi:MAG: hypothetical protein AB1899_06850 [Pseudomonadota bacterium]
MTKEVWGTFSVKDHLDPRAFVAEVMLYDRLVIPVPPDDDERLRWETNQWDPKRLEALLKILGDRAYPVPWDTARQAKWKARYEAGSDVAQAAGDWAFAATRTELTEKLPRHVTGIQVVTHYDSVADMTRELGIRERGAEPMPVYGGAVLAILGQEFFVPDDPRWSHADLLKQAVELSSERTAGRKRAAFWRWQREFFDDKGITDQHAVQAAVEEMQDLLEDQKADILRKGIRTGSQFAFLAGSLTVGVLGGPLSLLGIGGAFLSIGQFVADKLLEDPPDLEKKPAALVRDIRKHFGWR